MKAAYIITWTFRIAFWVPVIFFSILLTHNAMLYFTHGGEYGILPEKVAARQDFLWNAAFYIHLPSGIICLLTPIFLFAGRIFRMAQQFHSTIGKVYVFVTLAMVCPTGMYLALYAKGGFITQTGFLLQGILLGWFTWQGYRAIEEKNKTGHVHHMIRSYAIATVVLSFRILHILFFIWKVPYQDNYAISQWLGLTGNMLLGELAILITTFKLKNIQNLKVAKL